MYNYIISIYDAGRSENLIFNFTEEYLAEAIIKLGKIFESKSIEAPDASNSTNHLRIEISKYKV